jgi:oligoribonuclease
MNWLLWVDLETSGLDPNTCNILQIACILSDFESENLYELPEISISTENLILDNMDPWCQTQHTKSGLVKKVQQSQISLNQAEQTITSFIEKSVKETDNVYIAGNSVHFDKKFIDVYMPLLSQKLNYRIIDVSSIALICKELNPKLYEQRPIKTYLHTSQSDLLESIMEYKFYKEFFLKNTF